MNWIEEPEKSRFGSNMMPAIKQLLLFLVGWLGFQIFATAVQFSVSAILKSAGINYSVLGYSMIVNSVSYVCLLIGLSAIANKDLLKLIPSFKQWQSYLAGFICLASIFTFSMVYGTLINILKQYGIISIPTGDNANQAAIVSLGEKYTFTSLIVFGFIGPICEELTYRVGLFSLLRRKNKAVAYILTIIIFAFIHFNFSSDKVVLLNELLQLPHYMFAAAAFSFTYDKFGFAGSLSAHIANNVVSLVLVSAIL